jgi:hypothetical protein
MDMDAANIQLIVDEISINLINKDFDTSHQGEHELQLSNRYMMFE